MRKVILIVLAALVVAVIVGLYMTRPPREWSSKDPAAIDELVRGREALQKLYFPESIEHFRAALAHDSQFVAARMLLGSALFSIDQREPALREIREALKADRAGLTPREIRMLEIWRLQLERKEEELLGLLKTYAVEVPDDADILRQLASIYWHRGEEEEAVKWAEASLKVSPNDALAYNLLGYIEMSRGNFAASESALRKYTFIASNQANPHDSLGELYTVLGRWDEAIAEFNKALGVNPRFFPAHLHIARIAMLRGDEPTALAEAEQGWELAGMSAEARSSEAVLLRAWAARVRRDDAAFVAIMRESKPNYDNPSWTLAMVTALAESGEFAAARAVEERAVADAAKAESSTKLRWKAVLAATRAQRLLSEGKFDEALVAAETADSALTFSIDDAFLKLTARCVAAMALARGGDLARANQILTEITRVNPVFPSLARCREPIGAR